jgi:hypothetical protein
MGSDQPPRKAAAKPDPAPRRDSRRESRTACNRLIAILPSKTQKDWAFLNAELVDCSSRGAALIVSDPMSVGDEFLIKLETNQTVSMLLYIARNCTELPGRRYRVGAEFVEVAASPLGDQTLSLLDLLENPGS